MANIYSYPQIGELANADNLIISDASNGNKTKSVTIEQLSDYFGTGGGGVDNYVNGGSYSSGTLTLTRTGSLSDIDISGFLELGTTSTTALAGNTTTITQTQAGDIIANNAKVSFPEAPTDGQQYARQNSSWSVVSVGGGGTVTSIATTAPITGGTITGAGTIGITQASGNTNGYLSSTDWNTFNNKSTFDGQYSSLTGAPTLATVATSGDYNDLLNQPTIPTVPANIVETVTTTDGTFIDLTPDTATDGAVTITADFSATGTADATTFLRGDNTWAVPPGGGGGAVDSVNGQTGAVTLTTSDLTNDSGYIEGTTTGTGGISAITEIRTLTSGEYGAITPAADVMYVIV